MDDYTKVTLFRYKDISKMEKSEKIQACYWHSVLKYIKNEKMTNTSLRQRFQIADKHCVASRTIKETLDEKLIKLYDDGSKSTRGRKYVPIWS